MSEEELLKKNNVLMSHGHLPYDTSTCETYGLSGNCGKKCPNFKNKTCDVYVDVLERINQELQQQNQKYKEVIDKAIEYINEYAWKEDIIGDIYTVTGKPMVDKYMQLEWDNCKELLGILSEVE